jgi:hypothetical protein
MKYAQVTNQGYVVYFIEATVEQPDLVLIDYEIPVCPDSGYKFNVNTRTWDDSTEQEKYADAIQNTEAIRIDLLYKSDWTQIPNNPLTAEQQAAWATYRQELRDIPEQSGYPLNVVWPIAPV